MTDSLETLRQRMEAAAAALDFEEAGRLRDLISLWRGRPESEPRAEVDTSRLTRQTPGKMGLGTSDQVMTPPPGWTPPTKPDPMTAGHRPGKRRRR
ncbi:MAG TPA: UvrB/UvrC motif-containing protein [Caulobacteraceae bacterium]